MKKIFAVTVFLALASAAALSQMSTPNSTPTYNHKAPSWTGFYVGINAGEGLGTSSARTSTVFAPTGYFASSSVPAVNSTGKQDLTLNGITGGGQFGYNKQFSWLVLGLEADFGALSTDASATTQTTYPCCAPSSFTVKQGVTTDWIATVRPRMGVTLGKHTLLFVSGGVAETEIHYSSLFTDTFASAYEYAKVPSTLKTGWVAGGGMEFALCKHWSVRPEYLHASFGNASGVGTPLTTSLGSFSTSVFQHRADLNTDLVRLALNYRF